jgi:hypothetical protein
MLNGTQEVAGIDGYIDKQTLQKVSRHYTKAVLVTDVVLFVDEICARRIYRQK